MKKKFGLTLVFGLTMSAYSLGSINCESFFHTGNEDNNDTSGYTNFYRHAYPIGMDGLRDELLKFKISLDPKTDRSNEVNYPLIPFGRDSRVIFNIQFGIQYRRTLANMGVPVAMLDDWHGANLGYSNQNAIIHTLPNPHPGVKQHIEIGNRRKDIYLYDDNTGELLKTFTGPGDTYYSGFDAVFFSADGLYLIGLFENSGRNNRLPGYKLTGVVWDAVTGNPLHILKRNLWHFHTHWPPNLGLPVNKNYPRGFDLDGYVLKTFHSDGKTISWDIRTGSKISTDRLPISGVDINQYWQ